MKQKIVQSRGNWLTSLTPLVDWPSSDESLIKSCHLLQSKLHIGRNDTTYADRDGCAYIYKIQMIKLIHNFILMIVCSIFEEQRPPAVIFPRFRLVSPLSSHFIFATQLLPCYLNNLYVTQHNQQLLLSLELKSKGNDK